MIRKITYNQDYSGIHDSFCRCRLCRPPHPTDKAGATTAAVFLGLALLVIAIVVTL